MRDEEELIREHLSSWLDVAWCTVGAIDERTRDHSARAFLEIAGAAPTIGNRRFAYQYTFAGLGRARTDLLREAAARFMELTHVLFIDPDWQPVSNLDLTPILKATQENPRPNIFVFRILDRNGRTERVLDWCFSYSPTARFRFRWHEELVISPYIPTLLPWLIKEVPNNQSWHAMTNGGPATAKRYEFEIGLLEQDLTEIKEYSFQSQEDSVQAEARLRYYLGVDYLRLGDSILNNDDNTKLLYYQRCLEHLDAHLYLMGTSKVYEGGTVDEMTYVAHLQRALALRRIGNTTQAENELLSAIQYDKKRAEAHVQLADLYLSISRPDAALQAATTAASLEIPVRLFYHHPAAYGCHALRLALAALRAKGKQIETSIYHKKFHELNCHQSTSILRKVIPPSKEECSMTTTSRVQTALQLFLHQPDTAIQELRAADSDSKCCAPQRAFSQLFLGEAPNAAKLKNAESIKKEQLITALEVGLKNELPQSDWRMQYTYALAAMRHHLQDDAIAAGELLGIELGLNNSAPLSTHGRRMPLPSTNDIRVAAVASRETPALQNLRDSALAAGIDLHVLGVDDPSTEPYTGHEIKLRLLENWLNEQAKSDDLDRLVLLVDAFDVLLWPALRTNFRQRFLNFNADVVFGGDPVAYPDAGMTKLYQDYGLIPPLSSINDVKPFVNSGTIAGTVRSLLIVFELVFSFGKITSCGPDDQRAFHRALLISFNSQEIPSIRVDSMGLLFHCLHRELRPLSVESGQLFISGALDSVSQRPCVTHGNAGDGKELYTAIVNAWRTSFTSIQAQSVEPPLFMRGIELWRRGLLDEAEACWMNYLQYAENCSAPHATDLRFNLGVLRHQKNDFESAHQFYEAALQCNPNHVNALTNSAIVLAALDKLADAANLMRKAIQLTPDNPSAHKNLAYVEQRIAAASYGSDSEKTAAAPHIKVGSIYFIMLYT